MTKIRLKHIAWSVATAAALIAAGCGLPSVYPFYTDKDVVFEPALVGVWIDAATNQNTGDHGTIFEKGADKSYTIRDMEKTDTNTYSAHLFRLEDHLFLDCVPKEQDQLIPAHILVKVDQIQPTFKMRLLNEDWLEKILEKNPKALRHLSVTNSGIILTADTAELQAFLRKHLNSPEAFTDISEMKRQ